MSYKCTCLDPSGLPTGTTATVSNCFQCSNTCGVNYNCDLKEDNSTQEFAGITLGVFIALVVIQLLLWAVMIIFSVIVLKKCKGNPKWLNPTVITLLVLWLLCGWFPGIGFALFVALLIILIIFANQCKSGKKIKK